MLLSVPAVESVTIQPAAALVKVTLLTAEVTPVPSTRRVPLLPRRSGTLMFALPLKLMPLIVRAVASVVAVAALPLVF